MDLPVAMIWEPNFSFGLDQVLHLQRSKQNRHNYRENVTSVLDPTLFMNIEHRTPTEQLQSISPIFTLSQSKEDCFLYSVDGAANNFFIPCDCMTSFKINPRYKLMLNVVKLKF